MVPGVMGSRLKVMIDCEKLDKSVSTMCDNTCINYYNYKDPKARFITMTLWISLLSGAAKILNSFDNFCLGLLVSLDISKISTKPEELPGLAGVSAMFNDLGNSKTSECGMQSI